MYAVRFVAVNRNVDQRVNNPCYMKSIMLLFYDKPLLGTAR